MPATNGPPPNPPYSTMLVSREGQSGSSVGSISCIHALAATNTTPEIAPSRRRPANRATTLSRPSIITPDATAEAATPGTMSRRRPSTSDAGPAHSSAGSKPIG